MLFHKLIISVMIIFEQGDDIPYGHPAIKELILILVFRLYTYKLSGL